MSAKDADFKIKTGEKFALKDDYVSPSRAEILRKIEGVFDNKEQLQKRLLARLITQAKGVLVKNKHASNSRLGVEIGPALENLVEDDIWAAEFRSQYSLMDKLKQSHSILSYETDIETLEPSEDFPNEEVHDVTVLYVECDLQPFLDGANRYLNYLDKIISAKQQFADPNIALRLEQKQGGKWDGQLVLVYKDKEHKLVKPRFGSEAWDLVSFVIARPNRTFTKREIELGRFQHEEFKRRILGLLNDLGFSGHLKEIFFPHASNNAVEFRNNFSMSELEALNFSWSKIERQLQKHRERLDVLAGLR